MISTWRSSDLGGWATEEALSRETKTFPSSLTIFVHEWNCFSQTLNSSFKPPLFIWVNSASDSSTTHLQFSFTFTPSDCNGQHSLPQHFGMLPALLLISQTNYSRLTPQWPSLTNSQLTDPHMTWICCFVWGFDLKWWFISRNFIGHTGSLARAWAHMAGC